MLIILILLIVLPVTGVDLGELRAPHVLFCLATAVGGVFVCYELRWSLGPYFATVAVMDIVLVVVIFKGDIRIH